MNNEWQTVRLGDFCPFAYGKSLPERDRNNTGNYSVYGSGGIVGKHDTPLLAQPAIIVGRKGSVGTIYFETGGCYPIDTTFYVVDAPHRDLRFTYYLLSTIGLEQMNGDSAVPGLNRDAAHARQISIPSLPQQRAIARVLGSLDDKIECNRRMNATLEELAQTHFRALIATARTDDGELRDGWRLARISEVAAVNARSIGKNYPYTQIEYMDIASVSEGLLSDTTPYELNNAPSRARRLVQHGDTVWSTVRPNRRSFRFIHTPSANLVVSTGFVVLSPREIPPSYLYAWTTTQEFTDYLVFNADGSAYPAVLPGRFENAEILVPPSNEQDKFEKLVGSLRDKIAANELQNRTLTELRDFLLPRLLSGEITVQDALRGQTP